MGSSQKLAEFVNPPYEYSLQNISGVATYTALIMYGSGAIKSVKKTVSCQSIVEEVSAILYDGSQAILEPNNSVPSATTVPYKIATFVITLSTDIDAKPNFSFKIDSKNSSVTLNKESYRFNFTYSGNAITATVKDAEPNCDYRIELVDGELSIGGTKTKLSAPFYSLRTVNSTHTTFSKTIPHISQTGQSFNCSSTVTETRGDEINFSKMYTYRTSADSANTGKTQDYYNSLPSTVYGWMFDTPDTTSPNLRDAVVTNQSSISDWSPKTLKPYERRTYSVDFMIGNPFQTKPADFTGFFIPNSDYATWKNLGYTGVRYWVSFEGFDYKLNDSYKLHVPLEVTFPSDLSTSPIGEPTASSFSPNPISQNQTLAISGSNFGQSSDQFSRTVSIEDYGIVSGVNYNQTYLTLTWPIPNKIFGTQTKTVTINIAGKITQIVITAN